MIDLLERIRISYKKLKANIYFDKTQLPLRDRIVDYEKRGEIEKKLEEIEQALSGDDKLWNTFEKARLRTVGAFVYPKELERLSEDTVIFNSESTPIRMGKAQFFLDMDVAGHILGVLWVLSVGLALDWVDDDGKGMYEHSYGNRLKKDLCDEKTGEITYSPGLFEPYFSQYESWRDRGLRQAQERLGAKQDALILTLDFKSFYYSVDLRKEDFDGFLKKLEVFQGTKTVETWQKRVNEFVRRVLETYSKKLRCYCSGTELDIKNRTILPIGFLPSNILANWVLTPFDNAIISKWNPTYYGRYVDDIIIVDKVEKNSPLYRLARSKDRTKQLTAEKVIDMLLTEKEDKNSENLMGERRILVKEKKGTAEETETSQEEDSDRKKKAAIYHVDPELLTSSESEIRLQGGKVKMFYFQSGATQALLNCFRTQIARNASEFRLMPDLDGILRNKDYSEIFRLKSNDTINKFRSVEGVEIDKFSFSKFLGKFRKVSGLIIGKEETVFEKDLMLILDERTLIENYGMWERLFEIMAINGRITLMEKLALRIISAIKRFEITEKTVAGMPNVKKGLLYFLRSSLCRVSALVWGEEIKQALEHIEKEIVSWEEESSGCPPNAHKDFAYQRMCGLRELYCVTHMVNKYVIPLPLDCILTNLSYQDEDMIRLYDLADEWGSLDPAWETDALGYRYYPYMLKPEELSFALLCTDIRREKASFNPRIQTTRLKNIYLACNFPNVQTKEDREIYEMKEVCTVRLREKGMTGHFATWVGKEDGSDRRDSLCVAIGNAELNEKNFIAALDERPNRSYERYRKFAKILDEAIEQKVDLLVLPENYLPFEWLPAAVRACANNQMALVTGIEHIVVPPEKAGTGGESQTGKAVYNLTATILPYVHQNQKCAYVAYHNKVAYSPEEKRKIEGYGHTWHEGKAYQLFCWHDIWFPVYCCFELASIYDRALFRSYADLVVAVEWNSDIAYFSAIIESLCRDLHCYCIQANSSGPGDSRVLRPSKSELRDIIKTKGGKNPCILAADLDIKALRDFQRVDYNLQKENRSFKPTPPGLDHRILKQKRDGTLFKMMCENAKTL